MSSDNATVNISSLTTIEDVNQEKLIALIPVIIIFVLFMVVGIVGNILVVYVFGFRMKPGTQNILIVSLALFDVLTNVLSIPHEITVSIFIAMYPSAISCKIFRFINTFCSAGSMFTLLVIAVDRYRKICLPLRPQMYTRHVKRAMIPILAFSVLISLPAFAVHGQRTIDTDYPNLYGQDCSTPDEIGKTIIPLIYNLLMFLCFFTITIALAVLYTFILRETNRHNRQKSLRAKHYLPSASNSSSDRAVAPAHAPSLDTSSASVKNSRLDITLESDAGSDHDASCYTITQPEANSVNNNNSAVVTEGDNILLTVTNYSDPPCTQQIAQVNFEPKQVISPEKDIYGESQTANISKKAKYILNSPQQAKTTPKQAECKSNNSAKPEKKRFKNKTTLIAFLVTLVFILSFLPHFILQVTKFSKLIVDYRLHGAGLVAYNLFLRSYFINSVSNPFIYGALNTRFSDEVSRLWRRVTCRT